MPTPLQTPTTHDDWWISIKHGGLLIAPSKLEEFFVAKQLAPLSRYAEDNLRRDVQGLSNGNPSQIGALLDTVLEEVLGLTKDFWQKGSSVERDWAQQAITRETIKPRRVWQDDRGAVLPVFVADGQERGGQVTRLGIGRGKRAVSRVIEWLRKADQPIALLTNGYQWRLIHAGADYDAWCEWDIALWFEEGRPGPQVTALRLLLGEASVRPPQAGRPSPLLAAIQSSRQGQAELSDVLGERVRKAVEVLIRASSAALNAVTPPHPPTPSPTRGEGEPESSSPSMGEAGVRVTNRDIYIAASRIIMRCVVILFAEARDLLPRENPIYHSSYGLQGLREQLDRMAGGRASERLRNSYSAWPRLLALFRLVYEGSAHPSLPVPRYGGGLFAPGVATAADPVMRALAALEDPTQGPSDAVVAQMLELLCRSQVKVRQGRRSTWVPTPVDFSDLSSEYIGILYEGLLDFELRRTDADDPMIFLNLGDQPALPLTRLEGMDDKALESLVEKLKQKAKLSTSEDGDSDEDEAAEAEEEETEAEADDEEEDTESDDEDDNIQDDLIQGLRDRAHTWAIRAVKAGGLVKKPRSKKADALADYEQQVNQMAHRLIARLILPGEWFLVRWGGTRKGSGTFYTRPQLAVPTVQRTLEPLVYECPPHPLTPSPTRGEGEPDRSLAPLSLDGRGAGGEGDSLDGRGAGGEGDSPAKGEETSPLPDSRLTTPDSRKPKSPAEILSLRICDPACGSASFLIAALRYLTNALWESLFAHGWLIEDGDQIREGIPKDAQPEWFVECVKNLPLAVEKAEEFSKPRLKRYVVERCIYGVDINPLAVELGRLALWVETMDRSLAFGFLDHKIKAGNALVGCWFDQFQDYPIMAWEREAGDATHRGVHFGQKVWTKEIKRLRNEVVKEELRELLAGGVQLSMFENRLLQPPEQTHNELQSAVEAIHMAVLDPEEQAATYETAIRQKQTLQQLKWAFDCWCAVWFWQGNEIDLSPTPMQFVDPSPEVRAAVERVAQEYQFFHWELEFPDVFCGDGESGVGSRESGVEDGSELSRTAGLERGNHAGGDVLPNDQGVSEGGNLWDDVSNSQGSRVDTREYRGGLRSGEPGRVHSIPQNRPGIPQGTGNPSDHLGAGTTGNTSDHRADHDSVRDSRENATFSNPHPTTEAMTGIGPYQDPDSRLPTPDSRPNDSRHPGFDAIVGNPPWEIQKPNSKEFFSNIDPLYRTYGKQEALEYQKQYFEADATIEEDWLAYCARLKALSNWCKYVASAFGDDEAMGSKFSLSRRKAEAEQLATEWRKQRAKRTGYSDPEHPYRYQGSADVNTYKMFAELAHALTRQGGRFGLIIPSGIYTDKGSGSLRRLFLNRCQWTHLYAFQNERFVFSAIDHRNKMVIISVNKGGYTESIATRFRLGPGDSPEAQELMTDALDDARFLSVPAAQIKRFSPNTGALLEIRSNRDLKILEKMYANGVLLGDDGPNGWGIQYAREFDMTNDSKLFPPRPKWEAQGYKADEYGHWLKGEWRESGVGSRESGRGEVPSPSGNREVGVILSADGREMIRVDEVEDVALPLYQGVMIGQLESNRAQWLSGSGNRAVWEKDLPPGSAFGPQFLISKKSVVENCPSALRSRYLMRNIARTTDTRTMIGSPAAGFPAGHSLAALSTSTEFTSSIWSLGSALSSFIFDWGFRQRLGGTNLSWSFLEEMPILKKESAGSKIIQIGMSLAAAGLLFSREWNQIKETLREKKWKSCWAVTHHERLRMSVILDAVIAESYGLTFDDFSWILRDCDHPSHVSNNNVFNRAFDPKGFWRVDKDKDPEMRQTVLSLIAFQNLKTLGLDEFLGQNNGEGWMLPDTLRLADYGLGHDDRAKEPQPVATRLGERYLPWQLEGTPESSWAECERHAELLTQLLDSPSTTVPTEDKPIQEPPSPAKPIQQLDLFG